MRNVIHFILLFTSLVAIRAEATPTSLTFQSKIYKPDGHTLEAASVAFRFTTMDALGTCVLYVEDFNAVNMQSSTGQVVFNLGGGTKVYPAGAYTYTNVYNNMQPSFNCQSGGTFTPGLTDKRKVVMQFNDGVGGWQTAQAVDINSVPFANYASDSQKLAGYSASDFVLSSTIPNCDATGKILTYNGTSFVCVAVAGTGTVTNVTSANSYISVATGTTTPVITANVGTAANTLAAGNDSRITGAAQKSANLSDLASAANARTNLGLGSAAVLAVGTGAGTVAAGDDARITGAVQGTAYSADVANVLDSNCGTNATPKWNVALDAWTCVAISLNASAITAGTVATARLGSGTADATTYLRGDGTWATPASGTPANTQLVYQVRAATNANIALTGLQTIDDVVLVAGDRVLVKAQTTAAQNGIYIAAAGAWSRAADFSTWAQAIGYITVVTDGTSYGAMRFASNAAVGGTLGTTDYDWIAMGSSNRNSGLTALGTGALNKNTTGLFSTGVGRWALGSNTTGDFNTAVGSSALGLTTSGANNTALGVGAALANTSGSNNTSLGYNSFVYLTTGSDNVAVGHTAGTYGSDPTSALTTGSNNTFVGAGSGTSTANGIEANRITLLGSGARAAFPTSQTGVSTYSTAVGASASVTTVNTVVLGRTTDTTVIGSTAKNASTALLQVTGGGYFGGSVGVSGVLSPTAKLHIAAGSAAAGTGPLKLTAGTNLTTPEAGAIEFDGTNLYFTDSTPTRRTIAVAGGGGGTVTSVTSANSYLSIATTTTTPVITANVGTAANTLAAGDDSRITGAVQQTAYNGDIANVLDSNCGTGSTPKWNVATDMWTCVAIGSLPASAITTGTIATARLGSGTADATTYLRGDGTWAAPLGDVAVTYKVRAASSSNIALTGTQTIDDVVLVVGDRVLVMGQTITSTNGVYVVAAGAWARAADLSTSAQALSGYTVQVSEGSNFASFQFGADPYPGYVMGTNVLNFKIMGASINGTTAFGSNVLNKNTTGGGNSAFGSMVLRDNTTGVGNAGFGYQTLTTNTTGDYNTAVGALASGVSTTGANNTAVGAQALYRLSTGNSNVAIGYDAGTGSGVLNALDTGSNNVLIGSITGSTNANGTGADKVTLIGDAARTTFTSSQAGVSTYATAIGAGANVRTTNTVVLGRATDTTVIGNHTRSASPALLQVTGSGYFSSAVSVGVATAATGKVHIAAGTAAAGTAPIKLTSGVNLTAPEAGAIEFDGTNLYFTDSTPTRRTIATTASAGTVTSVTSANSYLSIATTTTTPVITANVGTGANTLAAGDDSRITGAVQQTAYNGDIANVLDSNCGTGSTPKWNTVADGWTCVAIGSLNASAITAGTIATARLGSGTADATTYLRGDGTWAASGLPANTQVVYQVRAVAVSNVALTGTQTIDGVALGVGDRVLLRSQTAPAENGVYVVAAGAWSRAADMSTWAQTVGYEVVVLEGTSWSGFKFFSTTAPGGTLETTAIRMNTYGKPNLMNGSLQSSTSFGRLANSSTTANYVTSIGYQANASGTAAANTSVGYQALYMGTSGGSNVAIGASALVWTTTGTDNVGIGRYAGGPSSFDGNVTGSHNIYIGSNTGPNYNDNATGANYVTLLGDGASTFFSSSQTGVDTYATAIGAGALVSTTNTIVLGQPTDATVIGALGKNGGGALLQVTGSAGISAGLGLGVNAPGASSILEMSSTTKGVVLPRMTKAQRDAIAAPVAGMMVYQTDNTPGLRVHNGTNWMRFTETAD